MSAAITLSPEENEQLRHAALGALAARHPVAVTSRAISRSVDREVIFTVSAAAIESALNFLKDKGFVRFEHDTLGSEKWWTITAEGLLQVERFP